LRIIININPQGNPAVFILKIAESFCLICCVILNVTKMVNVRWYEYNNKASAKIDTVVSSLNMNILCMVAQEKLTEEVWSTFEK